ncbi:unnamed protein product [Prunus armeniaca]|uniref:Uncharacterized protein n=1 Tax=Prunus armeniaca TaxID=36596 RepID=A0A6J5V5H2_PRUAR|nr:unnamed protein product [Prunus armeniaca]
MSWEWLSPMDTTMGVVGQRFRDWMRALANCLRLADRLTAYRMNWHKQSVYVTAVGILHHRSANLWVKVWGYPTCSVAALPISRGVADQYGKGSYLRVSSKVWMGALMNLVVGCRRITPICRSAPCYWCDTMGVSRTAINLSFSGYDTMMGMLQECWSVPYGILGCPDKIFGIMSWLGGSFDLELCAVRQLQLWFAIQELFLACLSAILGS